MEKKRGILTRRRKAIGCLLLCALFVLGAMRAASNMASLVAQAKQKKLEFATVKRGSLTRKVSETGTIAADLQVEVKSKVPGRVAQLLVDEGDQVRAGQLVARIDPIDARWQAQQVIADANAARARLSGAEWSLKQQQATTETSVQQAEAQLASAQANLRKLEAGNRPEEVARAEAQVARAEADAAEARQALSRALDLQRSGGTAREDAEAALAVARADLQRLEAGSRTQEIAAARATVAQARAAADDAARVLKWKRDLSGKGYLPHQELDTAQATNDQATAALEQAKQQLALVEAGPRKEEIAAARARVRQAEVTLKSAGSNADQAVTAARARSDAAEAALRSAREDLKLMRAGARKEDLDAARAQVGVARAELEAARAGALRDAATRAEADAARANLQSATGRVNEAQTQLSETNVVAPISGTVVTRYVRAGELVASAVSGLSAGVAIVTIADLSQLIVRVRLNEVDVAQVRVGQPVEVRVDAYPGVIFTGKVRRIAPAAGDAARAGQLGGGMDTQIVRFDVEVALDKPDPRLRTGMTAGVDVILDRREKTLYVVREALFRENDKWYANVVRDPATVRKLKGPERARLTDKDVPVTKVEVKAGMHDETRIEALSGLKENDLILISDSGRVQRRKVQIGD